MILPKPLALMKDGEIKEWLKNLILEQRLESVELDYKEGTVKVATIGEKKEFAADISSFANCRGGVLVYGIKEADRQTQDQKENVVYPLDFDGADIDDELLLRVDQVISSSIEPRLPEHPTMKPVKLALKSNDPEKWAIVIEVRKSWTGPHMITADKEFRYYTRQNFRKGPVRMDHWELNTLFDQSLRQTDKVAQWIAGRDAALQSRRVNRGPSEPVLFMLIVPHVLLDDRLDIGDHKFREHFADVQHNPYQVRFQPSLYGLEAEGDDGCEILLHRNLGVEYLQPLTRLIDKRDPDGPITFIQVCYQLIKFLMLGRNLYVWFGYDGPLRLKMDFIQGTDSHGWRGRKFSAIGSPQPWPDPALSIVEDVSALYLQTDPQKVVKQVLDRYFHAFGQEESDAKVMTQYFSALSNMGFVV